MDISSIASAAMDSNLPAAYTMSVMRKAMSTETGMAAREISLMMPQTPAPAVPKGQFLDVYA